MATTTRGLEEVALREIRELLGREGWVEHKGLVGVDGGMEEVYVLNLFSRSLYRVYLVLERGDFRKLEEIYKKVRELRFGDLILPSQAFAVRAERQGEHDFTSQDVARVVGQAIIESFLEERGVRLKVNLEEPDVIFRVEVRDDRFWFGLDTTGEKGLGKRGYRVYEHPAPLKPPIAYTLVRLSEWREEEGLLDPMCGSGTILIEAARYAQNIPNSHDFLFFNLPFFEQSAFEKVRERFPQTRKNLKLTGYDISPKHIRGAEQNARKAGVEIDFRVEDACRADLDFDRIVTNPPYGIRMGSYRKIEKLYRAFAENLKRHERWKSLVIISPFPGLFLRHFEMEPSSMIEVIYGELYTKVMVWRR